LPVRDRKSSEGEIALDVMERMFAEYGKKSKPRKPAKKK